MEKKICGSLNDPQIWNCCRPTKKFSKLCT